MFKRLDLKKTLIDQKNPRMTFHASQSHKKHFPGIHNDIKQSLSKRKIRGHSAKTRSLQRSELESKKEDPSILCIKDIINFYSDNYREILP